MGGQRDPSFELALGVVGEEAVRVVDDAAEARRRDVGQRGFDRRLGPRAATGVIEPAVDDAAEARRQPRARWPAQRLGGRQPGGDRLLRARAACRARPAPARRRAPCQPSSRGLLADVRGRQRRPAARRRAPAAPRSAPARGAAALSCRTVSRDSACVNAESAAYIGATHTGSSPGSAAQHLVEQRPPELVGDVHAPVAAVGCGQRLAQARGLPQRDAPRAATRSRGRSTGGAACGPATAR